jgi:hypothetical protein
MIKTTVTPKIYYAGIFLTHTYIYPACNADSFSETHC